VVVTIIHSPPTASSDSQSYSLGVGPQYLLPPGSKNYLTSVLGVRTSLGPHSNYLYLLHPSTTLTGPSRRRLRRLSDGGLSLSHSHTLTLSLSHSLTLSYCHTLQGCLVLSCLVWGPRTNRALFHTAFGDLLRSDRRRQK